MRYSPYSKYKACEHPWIVEVPIDWELKKLKYLANCFPSNVDKKTKDGEPSTLLCNYTDVYYNEEITPDIAFMKASATDEQIKKFTLKKNDVVITKDSEDPGDIAVPAVVQSDMQGVICGYHLAMVRAYKCNNGRFLKRVFDSSYARSVFATTCNGLTRYGLGAYALDNALFPQPPLKEQKQIAAFLDKETAKIDTLIEKQEKLIKLLQEKRQAVISHAVTKGLNPDVKMKDGGVEWLGMVPGHWEVLRLKFCAALLNGFAFDSNGYVEDGIPIIRIGDVKDSIDWKSVKRVSRSLLPLLNRFMVRYGDVLLAMTGATIGKTSVWNIHDEALLNQRVGIIRSDKINQTFLRYCALSESFTKHIELTCYGGAQENIGKEDIGNIWLSIPEAQEQAKIAAFLDKETSKIDLLIKKTEHAIELSKERRTALISAAVTGKIDVRNVVV